MIDLMGSPKPFLLSQITFGFIKSNHFGFIQETRAAGSEFMSRSSQVK